MCSFSPSNERLKLTVNIFTNIVLNREIRDVITMLSRYDR